MRSNNSHSGVHLDMGNKECPHGKFIITVEYQTHCEIIDVMQDPLG